MSNLIISLWSGPRNISTALMYAFAQRTDTMVVDEPLYGHYLRRTGFEHPGRNQVLQSQNTDGKKVIEELFVHPHPDRHLFIKNMAKHLVGLEHHFLENLMNIILIRDPAEMLASFTRQIDEPNLQETALKDQLQLLNELESRQIPVVVLDARDVLANPARALTRLCQFLDIEFQTTMLSWEAGPRPEDGIWAEHWYYNVHRSTGFQKPVKGSVETAERLKPLLAECQYFYDQLLNSNSRL